MNIKKTILVTLAVVATLVVASTASANDASTVCNVRNVLSVNAHKGATAGATWDLLSPRDHELYNKLAAEQPAKFKSGFDAFLAEFTATRGKANTAHTLRTLPTGSWLVPKKTLSDYFVSRDSGCNDRDAITMLVQANYVGTVAGARVYQAKSKELIDTITGGEIKSIRSENDHKSTVIEGLGTELSQTKGKLEASDKALTDLRASGAGGIAWWWILIACLILLLVLAAIAYPPWRKQRSLKKENEAIAKRAVARERAVERVTFFEEVPADMRQSDGSDRIYVPIVGKAKDGTPLTKLDGTVGALRRENVLKHLRTSEKSRDQLGASFDEGRDPFHQNL